MSFCPQKLIEIKRSPSILETEGLEVRIYTHILYGMF